jgi:hypothetical protein
MAARFDRGVTIQPRYMLMNLTRGAGFKPAPFYFQPELLCSIDHGLMREGRGLAAV